MGPRLLWAGQGLLGLIPLGSSGCMPASQGWQQQGSAGPLVGLALLLQHPRLAWLSRGGAAGLHEAAVSMVPPPHPPHPEPYGRWELPASAGAGRSWAAPAELARPEARGAVLGQGASDLFLQVMASRGQILSCLCQLWGFLFTFASPRAGSGRRGWARGTTLVLRCPSFPSLPQRVPEQRKPPRVPRGVQVLRGQTWDCLQDKLHARSWTQPSFRSVRRREQGICAQPPRRTELGLRREEGTSRVLLRSRVCHHFLALQEGAKLPKFVRVSAHE